MDFPCFDYEVGEVSLTCLGEGFDVLVSPYSLGCDVEGVLVSASTVEGLKSLDCLGKVLLLRGEVCSEQLMPKNFPFYNPDHHRRIVALLEEKSPKAIITATGKNPGLAGSLYPFPLINDGDFDIPSVYCKDVVGDRIAAQSEQVFQLKIEAERIRSTACNVLLSHGGASSRKVVVCAHIDAYGDSPGAVDNASGTVVLLLLAEMLRDYRGEVGVEIIAFNGEDHYSAGGQKDYLGRYGEKLDEVIVAVNVDGVGYHRGGSCYSLYGCSDELWGLTESVFSGYEGISEGDPWYSGDHSIFVQRGIPAIAFTSEYTSEIVEKVAHSLNDTPDLVDGKKLVDIASAIRDFILKIG